MKNVLIVAVIFCSTATTAQQKDPLVSVRDTSELKPGISITYEIEKTHAPKQEIKSFIIPATLITYGLIGLESDRLQALDHSIYDEIREDHPLFHTKIDNYLQHAPAVAVYGLNVFGIKGRNNFRDRTMIYLLANASLAITVEPLKRITKIQRPDSSGTRAFPSGHTATAFAAAEFLRMEYKDVSPWYGVAGYITATATGCLRLYNNKHWFSEVVAGAGIGILSTKLAYLVYPKIQRLIFKDHSRRSIKEY